MDPKDILLKNLRTIFLILLTFLMSIEILIPAFSEDMTNLFIGETKAKASFITDLYVSSVYTEIICTMGLFAHFKNNYRVIRVFNLFEGINCIFSLYISIRVFALSLLTALNLTLLYIGSRYERHLKQELQQMSDNSRHTLRRNQMQITTISRNNAQNYIPGHSANSDPCPEYEPPPPYSMELTQLPKTQLLQVNTDPG